MHTINPNHGLAKYPNWVKNLLPVRLNQILLVDITYIRFGASSSIYLSVIIISPKAVCYTIGKTLSTSLTISSIKVP
jgi:hypothetical protein